MSDTSKPNNKIANAYASYITDTLVGYFIGEPITYTANDDVLLQDLQMILEHNDEADENAELAKNASIYGVAYEMLYLSEEDNMIRFKSLNPKEVIPIFDKTVEQNLLAVMRYYEDYDYVEDNTYTIVEVIDATHVRRYKLNTGLSLLEEYPHYFSMVPVAIFKNNEEESGDFERVISLIDAYDKMQSDSLNDFEYFVDAYVENMKNRLDKDIHKFAKCPNMSDQEFASNASGIAIKFKLLGTENLVSIKERKFKRGLQQRFELMSMINNVLREGFDWRAIDINFTRNIPSNDTDIANMVNTLKDIVSEETLLAQIPFVEDVQAELERIKTEREENKELNPFFSVDLGYQTEAMANSNKEEKPEE